MRVVFFGTPAFAVPSLDALLEAGIEVSAVVTQPDRPRGRSHSTLMAPPVKERALAAGIPVLQPDRPRGDAFNAQMRALDADLGIVVAYGHLLPAGLLAIPRLGMANVHASLLPRWRGAAPIQWAILSGDRETGVAIMRVEAGLDTGAVWEMRRTTIEDGETAGALTERLSHLGAQALLHVLPRIAAGEQPVAQAISGVTVAPKIDRATARVRWDEPAVTVANRIRAMDPSPGAWATLDGAEMKLFGARVVHGTAGATPGTVVASRERLVVATAIDQLEIALVQPAGKRRMPAAEWLHGAALADGARFT